MTPHERRSWGVFLFRRWSGAVLLALAIGLLVFFVYLPGLQGGFLYDDYGSIVENPYGQVDRLDFSELQKASATGNSGPLGRPLSMLSFALNRYFSGLDPYYFKLVNLVIHLFNAALVFEFGRRVLTVYALRQPRPAADNATLPALMTAAAWALHPLNLTTVLYSVQRMTSLSALFVLAALIAYVAARAPGVPRLRRLALMFGGTVVFGGLGLLAKESAFLLPLYVLTVEAVLFRFRGDAPERADLKAYFGLFLALPLVAGCALFAYEPRYLLVSYAFRDFGPFERLLTEARVLWLYVGLLVWPQTQRLGFYHDDIVLSRGLLDPVSTLPAVAGIALVAVLALRCRRRAPLLSFAIGWFLAGHLLESTVLPLELMHEHRNYLPIVGPLLVFFAALLGRESTIRYTRWVALLIILLLAVQTNARAIQWQERIAHALIEVEHHPGSFLANQELGRLLYLVYRDSGSRDALDRAREQFLRAAALDEARQKPYFALIALEFSAGGRPAPAIIDALAARLRDKPLPPDGSNDFRALVDCHITGRCALSPDEVLRLFGAALDNRALTTWDRASILTQLASYYGNVLNDVDAAVTVLTDVRDQYPRQLTYGLNLVRLQIAAGQLDAALAELDRLAALPRWDDAYIAAPQKRERIAALRASLDALSAPKAPARVAPVESSRAAP